ncbi:alkaline phosphatase family protein [Timonella sp. A28]|uniref:alkaline phosphatase family protein n=1 Tax=Timonella sp. A28 TaxID=3442640 RepID=UPI003EBCD939
MPNFPAAVATQYASFGFVTPTYDTKSLATLTPAICDALGGYGGPRDHTGHAEGKNLHFKQEWGLTETTNVCLLLVDGLGVHNLNEFAKDAPFLTELNEAHTMAMSGFPSTTATSMGLVGTGQGGGVTGLIGYSALSPHTGVVGNFVSWKDIGPPDKVQKHPVLFEELAHAGQRVTSVGLSRFDGSGLTQAALRGTHYVAAETSAETVRATLKAAQQPGFTYAYWSELDKAGHIFGVGSAQWRNELRVVDRIARELAAQLKPGVTLIITADHGMVNVDFKQRIDIADDYQMARGTRALAGEPRCVQVYFNSPQAARTAYPIWREKLDTCAVLLTKDELIESQLYGDMQPHVHQWLGDFVAIMADRATLVDSTQMSRMALNLKGVHGSLTREEVEIPGIVHVI